MKQLMRRSAALVLVTVLTLSACGSGEDDAGGTETPETSSAPTESSEAPDASEESPEPDASDTPESTATDAPKSKEKIASTALQAFQCAPGDDGMWTATGTVKNSTEKTVSYQVTVFVGVGNAGEGRTAEVTKVGPDGVKNFAIGSLPAAGDNAVCNVKIVELP